MKVTALKYLYLSNIHKNSDLYRTETIGTVREIRENSVQLCCDKMAEAYGDFIKFGEYEHGLNKNTDVNIFSCSPYPEGAEWSEMAIRFCPFCSAKIEVEIQNA